MATQHQNDKWYNVGRTLHFEGKAVAVVARDDKFNLTPHATDVLVRGIAEALNKSNFDPYRAAELDLEKD